MKFKIYLTIACCFSIVLTSCRKPTTEDIVQNKVRTYLKQNLDKGDSYKSIQFGKLDSAFTTVKKTPEYKRYNACAGLCEVLAHTYEESYKSKLYADSAKYYSMLCDSLELIFVPDYIGWKIQHIYQTDNKRNGSVVNSYVFLFDKKIENIIDIEQVYRNLPACYR